MAISRQKEAQSWEYTLLLSNDFKGSRAQHTPDPSNSLEHCICIAIKQRILQIIKSMMAASWPFYTNVLVIWHGFPNVMNTEVSNGL